MEIISVIGIFEIGMAFGIAISLVFGWGVYDKIKKL
jgi:hypothetical protein